MDLGLLWTVAENTQGRSFDRIAIAPYHTRAHHDLAMRPALPQTGAFTPQTLALSLFFLISRPVIFGNK
jgi:hypothetical protein